MRAVTHKRGWPLMQKWHAGLWRRWEEMKGDERLEYEREYEERVTGKGLLKFQKVKRLGKRR